jgi:hypothetical protein
MILDNWWESQPPGQYLLSIVSGASSLLAACNDLSRYQVKSVLLQHVPEGESVLFVQNNSLDPFGTLVATKGTWTIDVVFRPNLASAERTYPTLAKWRAWISNALKTDKGAPNAQVAGLWEFEIDQKYPDAEVESAYNVALGWWNAISAFREISKGGLGGDPPGFYEAKDFKINAEKAWNLSPNYLGQDGVGIQLGSALSPLSASPLMLQGTQIPLPGSTTPSVMIDPATGQPVGSGPSITSWKDLNGGQKAVAMIAGAFIGYAIFKKFGALLSG